MLRSRDDSFGLLYLEIHLHLVAFVLVCDSDIVCLLQVHYLECLTCCETTSVWNFPFRLAIMASR